MKEIEKLYQDYRSDLYHYLLGITHNPTLSEDLLSETFIKAIYSIGNFRGDSSLKTWLFSIARHLWLQNLRKDKPAVEYSDLLQLYVADDIAQNMMTRQITDRVGELLKTKNEQTRKIVSMRVNGISYYEISRQLDLSENSARVIDFRTKKWLKSILQREELL